MVLGVRIRGEVVEDVEVALDSTFSDVPIPSLLGVPLRCKRLPAEAGHCSELISRLVSNPAGARPDRSAPNPVIFGRSDKLPFSQADCALLDSYIRQWTSLASDQWEVMSENCLTPEVFLKYVVNTVKLSSQSQEPSLVSAFLSLQFPIGCAVKASGLSKPELNGAQGSVVQYSRDRVGVKLEQGLCALRPERLVIVQAAPVNMRDRGLTSCASVDSHPKAKVECVNTEGQMAKNQEVSAELGSNSKLKDAAGKKKSAHEKQCDALAKNFVDDVLNDVLPLSEERVFWGIARVNEDFHGINDVVFNVWIGFIRHDMVSERELADALVPGKVEELFKAKCCDVARNGFPALQGRKLGLKNTIENLLDSCERLASTEFRNVAFETID